MKKKKILVVDDDPVFLDLAEYDLTKAGYGCLKAKNGKEAFTIARNFRPDLILLDIYMPELDGAHLGELLKKDLKTKMIPIIYVTSLITRKEEKRLGNKMAGNIFVAKPYEPKSLLALIERELYKDM